MREWIQGSAGALLFAAALALSLPGVSVRADPAAGAHGATAADEAAMCRADAPLADPEAVHGAAEALRRQALANPGDGSVRVLNGDGYNYKSNRKVDFRALEREIRLRRARSH
jgi:hypothetical protein